MDYSEVEFSIHDSEARIAFVRKQVEDGVAVGEACHKHGTSEVIFYKYKAKLGGVEVSGAHKCSHP